MNKPLFAVLNPRTMVEMGAVTKMKDPEIQIQPNGVDLRIGKLMGIPNDAVSELDFDNSQRKYPEYIDILLPAMLGKGEYIVQYAEIVTIPPNVMAQVIMRSSLQRMGARLFSSVYDSGYTGNGMGLLVLSRKILVHPDARVGQIVFFSAESAGEYNGIHKGEGVTKPMAGDTTTHVKSMAKKAAKKVAKPAAKPAAPAPNPEPKPEPKEDDATAPSVE